MWLHPPDLVQGDPPFFQRRIVEVLGKLPVLDRLDFRRDEGRGLADFREQILQLPHPREVIGIRAVLGQLERGVVINAFDFQIERLIEFEQLGERRGRFADPPLPVR